MEYWSPRDFQLSVDDKHFAFKMDTDLYILMKAKARAYSINMSRDGTKFVVCSSDQKIRIFRFLDGKLSRAYDESPQSTQDLQRAGGGGSLLHF